MPFRAARRGHSKRVGTEGARSNQRAAAGRISVGVLVVPFAWAVIRICNGICCKAAITSSQDMITSVNQQKLMTRGETLDIHEKYIFATDPNSFYAWNCCTSSANQSDRFNNDQHRGEMRANFFSILILIYKTFKLNIGFVDFFCTLTSKFTLGSIKSEFTIYWTDHLKSWRI